MNIDELKMEADLLGYHIVKKQKPIRLNKCIYCGGIPELYYTINDKQKLCQYYKCDKCNIAANIDKKKTESKRNWNKLMDLIRKNNNSFNE